MLVCKEKEVSEVFLVGEGKEEPAKAHCGAWGKCPDVPGEGPWLGQVGPAVSGCRALETAHCRGAALLRGSIQIVAYRGV